MSLLAATAPERAPNGDFGGRSFQAVGGAPTGIRATGPGFPGAANTPGQGIGAPEILRDTPGRRTDATVQYNCVVPMGPKFSREHAETEGLHPGALCFVHNDESLEKSGRYGPDKMQRLVSYEHLASHLGGSTMRVPGVTGEDIQEAREVQTARGYPDAVQVIELRSDYQVIPLEAKWYENRTGYVDALETGPPSINLLSFPYLITVDAARNTQQMLQSPFISAWLKTPFLMWAVEQSDASYGTWESVRDNPFGTDGPPWSTTRDAEVRRVNGGPEYAAEQTLEPIEKFADLDDMPQMQAYRMYIEHQLDGAGLDGACVNAFRAHGIVIYKFATQGKDIDAEIELDYRQNGIFNVCIQGKTLSAPFTSFATAARNSHKRQKRLVTLPRDRMYIVVVGRLNLTGKGNEIPQRNMGQRPPNGQSVIDHIRYERTTSEEFLQKMRYRMSIEKGSFLRENEVILGAWRIGSVVDNAASRAMPSGSPTSALGLQAMGITLQVGIRWVTSYELHETYYMDLTETASYEPEMGTAVVGADEPARQPNAVNAELTRRAEEFIKYHNELKGLSALGGSGNTPPPFGAPA